MRASACFHGADTSRFQGTVAHEEFSVFFGEDVVGHGGKAHTVTQSQTELEHESGLAASDRSPHAHGERTLAEVARPPRVAFVKAARVRPMIMVMIVRIVRVRMAR